MKNYYAFLLIVLLSFCSVSLAQEKPLNQDKSIDLLPKFSGDARMWLDIDMTKHQGNFLARNARLLITGNASEFVSYKFLLDFAALAKTTAKNDTMSGRKFLTDATTDLAILNDAYISVKPVSKLSLSLGQFKVPFSTENLTSTNSLSFSNRPLMSARITPDIYDIGFMVSYSLPLPIAVDIDAAAFNGTGQNKSDNDKTDNYSFRAVIKPVTGLDLSGNYAGGTSLGNKVDMFDLGAGYKLNGLTLAGEYAKRKTTINKIDNSTDSYFTYAIYDFPLNTDLIKFISPGFRYEYYEPSSTVANDEVNRMIFGLTLSFAKLTFAHFRINYEKFSYKTDYKGTDKSSDRLVFEYQIRF